MPVQAHGGGVVLELATRRVEDGLDKVLHGFPDNTARLLVRRKRAWYFADAVVCADSRKAPALDDRRARRSDRR
jgi:hypothetical protein